MSSENPVPVIPKDRPIKWEEWLAGRRARRQTGNRVAPEVLRRAAGSADRRLRKRFGGDRGLPFKQTQDL